MDEILWVNVSRGKGKAVIVVNIYRPPDQPLNEFLSRMENSLSKIERSNCERVLFGDFNVDFSISTKNLPLKRKLNRLMGLFD